MCEPGYQKVLLRVLSLLFCIAELQYGLVSTVLLDPWLFEDIEHSKVCAANWGPK